MNSPNFSSILDEAPTEIDRPKPLPPGSYTCVVAGAPVYDKSAKKGTPFVQFTLKPQSAGEDVDEDELEAVGGLENKTFRVTFYLTEDAVYRLDEFHEHCGIDLADGDSRRSRNEAVMNATVGAFLKHEPAQDGSQMYAKVGRTFAVD